MNSVHALNISSEKRARNQKKKKNREKWMTFRTISFSSRFNSIKSLLISIKSNTSSGFQTMNRSIIHLYVCSFAPWFGVVVRLFFFSFAFSFCHFDSKRQFEMEVARVWMCECPVVSNYKTMHPTAGNLIQIDRNWIIFHIRRPPLTIINIECWKAAFIHSTIHKIRINHRFN